MRKGVEHTKLRLLVFFIQSLFAITLFGCHWRERKQSMKMSRLLWTDREKYIIVRKERADIELDIIFPVFCYRSWTSCLLGVMFSHLRRGRGTPSRRSPLFTLSHLVSNPSFFCFLSHVPLNGFSVWVSFT